MRFLSHPWLACVLFLVSPFALYYSPIFEATLRYPWIHNLSHLHFLIVGCLLFWAVVGIDPLPHRLPYPLRFGLVLGMGPMHVLLGIPIMMGSSLLAGDYYAEVIRSWGASPLADQQFGGALLWVFGDVTVLAFLPPLIYQWVRADQREARRVDRQLDRLGDGAMKPWWHIPSDPSESPPSRSETERRRA